MSRRAGLDQLSVVEAAARLIDEEGIEQLSLGKLAERLGVRTPSLYNHVAGLPGLKHELVLYSLRDLQMRLLHAIAGKSKGEAILALADAYREYARIAPGCYLLTQQAPDPDDQEWQELGRQLVQLIQQILVPYQLKDEDAIHAIRGLRSLVHGFITLEVNGGFGMPIDREASFHWLITMFIASLEGSSSL
ncbi:TetR/AcrR family transcriptional regulator [Dictyobacter aurantiacus]|uniref:TetR family transcriptional regulator n=1 Tax=Dictyobacter aurantiacus TaxID=1936993 RepID=A0A401Z8E0_9CHLR|nr:TetR-like C-terminal domain-containing protein [Dictyobacter aurantiacus]GCE03124.1 TetR family transcriptional regulator [Dictyobacter aurantiacus]